MKATELDVKQTAGGWYYHYRFDKGGKSVEKYIHVTTQDPEEPYLFKDIIRCMNISFRKRFREAEMDLDRGYGS